MFTMFTNTEITVQILLYAAIFSFARRVYAEKIHKLTKIKVN